ncbi:unnamed protein product [Penicillium olsonii]|nr:unnamed protein product [Penicillium olsonii]
MPPKAARGAASTRGARTDSTTTASAGAATEQNTSAGTDAPGPANRASVQRLKTTNKRTPSGSIGSASRPSPAVSGEPVKPVMKHRPKAVGRRSKQERDEIERLEKERHNERLKEAAAIQRGRGGPRRAGFRGRGGPTAMSMGGSFGGRGGKRGRGGFGGGGGGGGGGGYGGGAGSGRNRSGLTGGHRGRAYDSSDDEDNALRISIDHINLDSDEEDWIVPKDPKGKQPSRSQTDRALRPVRLERHEHEERVISVNMESSSARAADLRKKAETEKKTIAKDVTKTPTKVKAEPRDDDASMADDIPQADDDGFLPEHNVRVRSVTMSPTKRDTTEPQSSPTTPEPKPVDPRSLLHTKEEIDEYDRHQDDLAIIKDLLVPKPPKATTVAETTEGATEGETPTTEGQAEEKSSEEEEEDNPLLGQLFLMQFPPMTPNLRVAGAPAENQQAATETTVETEPALKTEPEVKREAGDDVEIVENTQHTEPQRTDLITAGKPWSLPSGRVGKLNVHKSGRVTLDWGGISMELDRGAPVGFVQEAMIVSPTVGQEGEAHNEDGSENKAWSMGQLSGKFTLTPNWDEIL